MKKVLLLLIALTLGFGVKAQCPLTTAVDFTATDCHGTEVHLFDILDSGQYVLIDFFFYNCGACNTTAPMMVQSYQAFGCNMHDVYYMEISDRDSDATCQNWTTNYGVEYPTISGSAGGYNITTQYGISAWPTVILIAPDHSIVINDLWPINNAQTVISALEGQGVQQHDCNAPITVPEVTVVVNEVTETTASVSFFPNEDCAAYYYNIYTEAEMQAWISTLGISAGEVLQTYGFEATEAIDHDFDGLDPQAEYFVWVVPADDDGTLYEVQQVPLVETPIPLEEMPDFTATDIDGNEIRLYDILDGGQTVLINFFLRDDNNAQVMPFVVESYQLFGCNQNDVFFMEICPQDEDEDCRAWAALYGVEYPTISRTGGGNDIVQSVIVAYFPTVMIINPDHTIAYRDLYPIENTQTIVTALEGLGCQQSPCYEGTLTFDTDTLWVSQNQNATLLTIYNNTVEPVVHLNKITIDSSLDWYYFMYGDQQISLNEEFDIPITQGEGIQLEIWMNIYNKELIYPVLRFDNSLVPVTLVTAFDWYENIQESGASKPTLFPNPANDFVTLKGENLGTVRIYNALGQKVDEFKANDNELCINTSGYGNGVYFIKVNNTTLRFVITH